MSGCHCKNRQQLDLERTRKQNARRQEAIEKRELISRAIEVDSLPDIINAKGQPVIVRFKASRHLSTIYHDLRRCGYTATHAVDYDKRRVFVQTKPSEFAPITQAHLVRSREDWERRGGAQVVLVRACRSDPGWSSLKNAMYMAGFRAHKDSRRGMMLHTCALDDMKRPMTVKRPRRRKLEQGIDEACSS